ncbi:MAG: cytochrome c [bacterium]|nr:cytochrome c [bacterium]
MKKLVFILSIFSFLPTMLFASDAVKGKEKFETLCASCHGATGAGDGAIAAAFPADQKPRNLKTGPFKFATDEAKFKELLKKGGASVGLSPLMPMQAGLTDQDIDNVYAYIKSLKN